MMANLLPDGSSFYLHMVDALSSLFAWEQSLVPQKAGLSGFGAALSSNWFSWSLVSPNVFSSSRKYALGWSVNPPVFRQLGPKHHHPSLVVQHSCPLGLVPWYQE
jgi:hypothetical protein